MVLVVDLSLGESLVALLTDLVEALFKAHLLRVVELLELSKLLLGVPIDLVNRVLQLLLLLLKLVFKLSHLVLKTCLGGFDRLFMLRVLLLRKGEVLVSLIFRRLQRLAKGLNLFFEVLY